MASSNPGVVLPVYLCSADTNCATASAFSWHKVSAAYAELDTPILDNLEVNLSGRYDIYSEGFNHFSTEVGVKITPIPEFAIRGTYSQGFCAPTFTESGPRSQYGGSAGANNTCVTGCNAYNVAPMRARRTS